MSKGLYHCSRCKQHFYDHEATAMHIKNKHGGKGKVLRHPTKKELLIRDEQQRARIKELQAQVSGLLRQASDNHDALCRAEAAEAKLAEQVEWVKSLADDLIAAEGREAELKAELGGARNKALEEAARLMPNYHDDEWIESLRAPHFKRVLAVLDKGIREMMEDDET